MLAPPGDILNESPSVLLLKRSKTLKNHTSPVVFLLVIRRRALGEVLGHQVAGGGQGGWHSCRLWGLCGLCGFWHLFIHIILYRLAPMITLTVNTVTVTVDMAKD